MPAKLNRMELVKKIQEVIGSHSNDPADEMIALGEAMVEIGKALQGQSVREQRAILAAVKALETA